MRITRVCTAGDAWPTQVVEPLLLSDPACASMSAAGARTHTASHESISQRAWSHFTTEHVQCGVFVRCMMLLR